MHPDIQKSVFTVINKSFCGWGWDLSDRNARFLRGFDAEYFDYVAASHLEHLDGDDAQRAAMALRTTYHHCLETLFSLMGACLQAPDCLPGWILNASTGDVRILARSLSQERMTFPIKLRFPRPAIGFRDVAEMIFRFTNWAATAEDQTAERFSELWSVLAADFLNEYSIKEYNSIKHGFRARAGGFHLRVGLEHEYGVAPPENEMRWAAGSAFGSSFYVPGPVAEGPLTRSDPHFVLKQHSLNWSPQLTALRLQLATMSISNIKGFLSILLGEDPGKTRFYRPENGSDFAKARRSLGGINQMNFDLIVSENDITRFTREELSELILQSRNNNPEASSKDKEPDSDTGKDS